MTLEEFINETKKLGIILTKQNLEYLEIYKNMLIEYNKKFNLTAITEPNAIYLKHFYDSLTIVKTIDLSKELSILDIGTGAGFPGLVLKIIYPNLKVTLLDANHKKISFLNEVCKSLNLNDVNCIHSRSEDLPNIYRESFDIVVSRAVAPIRILLELSFPYLKVNGYFIAMKSNIEEELKESIPTLKILNGEIQAKEEFKLPIENSLRTIIKIVKQKPTPSIYPRIYDKIKKKPLSLTKK